jgi:hypothetical protein
MPDDIIPPPSDINVPPPDYFTAGKLQAEGSKESGWPERLAAAFILALGRLFAPLLRIFSDALDLILAALGVLFLAGQGEGSRGFATLVAVLIGDLLGVEGVSGDEIFTAFQTRGRIKAMQVVGSGFLDVLSKEMITSGTVNPEQGDAAVRAFLGFVLSFAVRQGNIEFLTSLLPEGIRLGDGFRMYGELMAKNLGLGRLTRMVLKPLVTTLAATPFQWKLNELYRPTQLKLADVVNPFTGAVMDAKVIWADLAREGYTDDKIQALLELHRKKLSEADLSTLFSAAHIDQATLQKSIARLGYTLEDAQNKAEVDRLDKVKPYFEELRAAAVSAYADGHIDRKELEGVVDGLPLTTEEKTYILLAADYKRKVPTKHLTIAQLENAFVEGIIDLTEFTDHLAAFGYSDDDESVLLLLTLLKLAKTEEAAKAKAARAAATAAKKAGGKASPLPPPTPPGG